MKLYLDTNIILGWFKKMMESTRKGEEFSVPSVMEFLSSRSDLDLVVSNLTRAEIFRYLFSEWAAPAEKSVELWGTFAKSFKIDYTTVMIPAESINGIADLCLRTNTKKNTLTNLLHLEISKNYGLEFLTGEKDLKDRYSAHYGNIVTYRELRQKLS
jgi:hypothetical protein